MPLSYCTCESLTEKLLSCYKVKGFPVLLVCFALIFCSVMTCIRCIGVDFPFGPLDCVRYNEGFVISRFVVSSLCSIHFTVTLAGLTNIVRHTPDFVICRFVKSRFYCSTLESSKSHICLSGNLKIMTVQFC